METEPGKNNKVTRKEEVPQNHSNKTLITNVFTCTVNLRAPQPSRYVSLKGGGFGSVSTAVSEELESKRTMPAPSVLAFETGGPTAPRYHITSITREPQLYHCKRPAVGSTW